MKEKFLIITTNRDAFEVAGMKTGLWLSELVTFYNTLEAAGYDLDIASPLGGKTPLDPQSLIMPQIANAIGLKGKVKEKYNSKTFADKLENTLSVDKINIDDYAGIYLTGGHGVMFDYPHSEALQNLIAQFYEADKVVSAVCHGPSGLLNVNLSNGYKLIYGKRVTGYSWFEEKLARIEGAVPFNLEKELIKARASYTKSKIPFGTHVVADGNLITGQNPMSTKKVAQTVLDFLNK